MGWSSFAREALAGHYLEARVAREAGEFVDREAEVAMLEWLHRRAVRMPAKRRGEHASATACHARGFRDDRGGPVAVGQRVHEQHEVEACIGKCERMHVAEHDLDVRVA